MSSESPAVVLYDLNGVPLVGSAGTGSAAILTIQGNASGTPVPVSGTVTAANASVSTTGSAAPGSATFAGALVTTSVQSGLTATDMYALNMTTTGLLRVDGSNVNQPVVGTGTAGTAATGVVTIQGIASMTPVQVSQATAANLNATVVGSGNFTVVQPTASSLNATVVGTGTGGAVSVAQATAANLNATVVGSGSAGTPATGVVTIQGISGGTAIPTSVTAADTTSTGSLNALNAAVSIAVTGQSNAAMQLVAGTLIGTIVAEASVDGGTTWVPTFFDDPATSNVVSSIVFGSSNTATTRTIVGVGGASNVRVRVSAFTSGTATANLRASFMADPSFLSGGAAGAALPPVLTQVGASVTTSAPTYTNATMNALSLDTSGNLRVLANAGTGTFNVAGTGTAGTPGSAVLTIQGISGGTPIPVSGTVTATNASVSTTGSVAPGSATFAGALVTTSVQSGLTATDMYALNMTTTGLLRVDGSNVTQPVSGTVTANAGTGNFTVVQSTAASLNATVVGSGNFTVVQPTAASLNATVVQSTAANLNAAVVGVGTAGTPSGGVLTVQGSASGTAIPVSGTFTTDKSSTSAITSVASSTSTTSLLASNTNRVSATFWNDSTSQCYIALASTASATAYTIKMFPGAYWELPITYTGAISCIWVTANGNMRITELTP